MTPEARLQIKHTEDQWYCVVISDLENDIRLESIQNKVFVKTDDGYQKGEGNSFYSTYATIDIYKEGIELFPTHSFITPENEYHTLTEKGTDIVNNINYFCNNFPCAVIWHDGTQHKNCQFHGLHIHLICGSEKILGKTTIYDTVRKRFIEHGIEIKYQKIKYLENLIRHLQTPPTSF